MFAIIQLEFQVLYLHRFHTHALTHTDMCTHPQSYSYDRVLRQWCAHTQYDPTKKHIMGPGASKFNFWGPNIFWTINSLEIRNVYL